MMKALFIADGGAICQSETNTSNLTKHNRLIQNMPYYLPGKASFKLC